MWNKVAIITLSSLITACDVAADNMSDIIQYFNEDFDRFSPYDLAQQYKTKIENISGLLIAESFSIETKSRRDLHNEFQTLGANQRHSNDENRDTALSFILTSHGLLNNKEEYAHNLFHSPHDQISGYYDIKNKKMVLLDSTNNSELENVLLHEMVHAAQDEYFELKNIYFNNNISIDEYFANIALIEGQAEMVGYLDQLYKHGNKFDHQKLLEKFDNWLADSAPNKDDPFETFRTFPYMHGLTFVLDQYLIHENHDFKLMLDRIPNTTEQVLHRSKYHENEQRLKTQIEMVEFSGRETGNHEVIFRTSLGELYILQMLTNIHPTNTEANSSVASGWGGDHIVVLKNNNHLISIWELIWDTNDDAVEFYNMYKNYYANNFNKDSNNTQAVEKIILKKSQNKVIVLAGDISDAEYQKYFANLIQ